MYEKYISFILDPPLFAIPTDFLSFVTRMYKNDFLWTFCRAGPIELSLRQQNNMYCVVLCGLEEKNVPVPVSHGSKLLRV